MTHPNGLTDYAPGQVGLRIPQTVRLQIRRYRRGKTALSIGMDLFLD